MRRSSKYKALQCSAGQIMLLQVLTLHHMTIQEQNYLLIMLTYGFSGTCHLTDLQWWPKCQSRSPAADARQERPDSLSTRAARRCQAWSAPNTHVSVTSGRTVCIYSRCPSPWVCAGHIWWTGRCRASGCAPWHYSRPVLWAAHPARDRSWWCHCPPWPIRTGRSSDDKQKRQQQNELSMWSTTSQHRCIDDSQWTTVSGCYLCAGRVSLPLGLKTDTYKNMKDTNGTGTYVQKWHCG